VGERQPPALLPHARLLGEYVQVEADAVPGEKRVALRDLLGEVADQSASLLPAHPVRRSGAVTAMPQDRLLAVA
jgi:hypothetical protein